MGGDNASVADRARPGADQAAIRSLLEDCLPELHAFIQSRLPKAVRDHETSSDVAQSVCRQVLEGADRFACRGEAAFRGWLFAKARSEIHDRVRYYFAQKRDVRRDVESVSNDGDDAGFASRAAAIASPSRIVIGREELDRVAAAFDDLPADYCEILILARVFGLSRAEIAARIGRSEGSVRGVLRRAMCRLRSLLARRRALGG